MITGKVINMEQGRGSSDDPRLWASLSRIKMQLEVFEDQLFL